MNDQFLVSKTLEAAKIQVLVYVSKYDSGLYYIQQRYLSQSGVIDNWYDNHHNLVEKPEITWQEFMEINAL